MGSVLILYCTKYSSWRFNSNMKLVPGEIALLSKRSGFSPEPEALLHHMGFLGFAEREGSLLIIFALGATPSTTKNRIF
jgi:hypothetical protein